MKRQIEILKDYEEKLAGLKMRHAEDLTRLKMLLHFSPARSDRQLVNLANKGAEHVKDPRQQYFNTLRRLA